jgi:outer membrane protein
MYDVRWLPDFAFNFYCTYKLRHKVPNLAAIIHRTSYILYIVHPLLGYSKKTKQSIMRLTKIALFCALFFTVMSAANAQKIGHTNASALLALMPEAGRADSVLVIFRNEKMMKGDSMGKLFEREYKAFVEAYNAGTVSAAQAQKRQEELQKAQQYLQNYGRSIEEDLATLRRQLLQPLVVKLDEAVRAVGKEGNYQAIFDTSNGSALFAAEADDVTPLIKAKLGLK